MKEKMIEHLKWYADLSGFNPSITEEIEGFLNDFFNKYQPERSKREDDIMYLICRCGEYKNVFADRAHMDRCGALNIVETQ